MNRNKFKALSVAAGSAGGTIISPYIYRMVENKWSKSKLIIDPPESQVMISDEYITNKKSQSNQRIIDAYNRIKRWLSNYGNCEISFTISAHKNKYSSFEENILKDVNSEIFLSLKKLENKSKFEKFADDLYSQDPYISEYIKKLEKTCDNYKRQNKRIIFHWRDEVNRSNSDINWGIIKDLKNVWLDERSLGILYDRQ